MLLIFDLDDTLYQSFDLRKAREDAMAKLIMKHKKTGFEKASSIYHETQERLKSEGKKYTSRATFEELGISLEEFNSILNSVEIGRFVKEDKDIVETLKNLSKIHDITILSNSPKFIVEKTVELIGIKKFLRKVYTAEELGIGKPEPSVFRMIAEEMGYDAKDCVSIGDSVHKEIIPAKAAGMRTVLLLAKTINMPKEEQKEADFVIKELKELPDVLSQIVS